MERTTIDRAFAEKHLPLVYKISLGRLGDAALARVACKRVFTRVQETMDENAMPAEQVLIAWLTFLTEDVVNEMLKHMPLAAATASQPVKKMDAAVLKPPAVDTVAKRASSPSAQPRKYTDAPRADRMEDESIYAALLAASPAPTPAAPAPQRAAATAGVSTENEEAFEMHRRRAPKRSVARDTDIHIRKRKRPLRILIMVLFGMFILINLWFIVGLLCSRGILPRFDLGYAWFDACVFKLFNL